MDGDRSLDILGVKGISDSVRIATERVLAGAAAFLSRVCLPAAEEFGFALRDRISAWRARNATRMLDTANTLLLEQAPETADQVQPRLVHLAIEQASWTEDDVILRMWAGLLASATSPDGKSDENLMFMNILGQLSSLEVRVLNYAATTASKFDGGHGLPLAKRLEISLDDLPLLFGIADLQRLDRELDHLRELGLIGDMDGGGIRLSEPFIVDLTPTALALHLYVRAQGVQVSPAKFWNLQPFASA